MPCNQTLSFAFLYACDEFFEFLSNVVAATQRVYTSRERPSQIVLPVIR